MAFLKEQMLVKKSQSLFFPKLYRPHIRSDVADKRRLYVEGKSGSKSLQWLCEYN